MEFAKYIAIINRHGGPPNLSADQFSRMMNIMTLESKIDALDTLSRKNTNMSIYSAVMMETIRLRNRLNMLTQGKKPPQLFEEMLKMSR
jgi:hypothetical protein